MSALRVSRLSLYKAMYQTDFVALILPVHAGDIQKLHIQDRVFSSENLAILTTPLLLEPMAYLRSWLPAWGCIDKIICCSIPSMI